MPHWKTNHHHAPYCVWDILSFDRHVQKLAAKETSSQLVLLKAEHAMHCSMSSLRCIITHTQLIALAGCFNDCAQLLISTWISCAELQRTTRWDSQSYDSTVAFSLSKISCLVGPGVWFRGQMCIPVRFPFVQIASQKNSRNLVNPGKTIPWS